MNSTELLLHWCREGWRYRGVGKRSAAEREWYGDHVKSELKLILDKDFADFFLATSDMVRWAKDHGIAVGPGRGSVAASVVAWLLRITEVDPYKYPQLMFERFLDETRTDMPDIDLDVSDERRGEIVPYMESKYGQGCVGIIGNYVRYRGKNALTDVARVYNVPKGAKETIINMIVERSSGDSRFSNSLEDTAAMFPAAKEQFDHFPDLWKALKLEGNVRGMSIHAAGMVVANSPLTDICAIIERDGRQVIQIDKYDCEYAGMLKMDVLGLTTMGVISHTLEMAGLTLEDLYEIPDDDPEALAVFKKGDVTGVFQFEGRATRLVNRDVSPDNFYEVVDVNALSRPGPLFSGTTAEYCDVKHGRREPERFHPLISELTKDTRGQIVYQEQMLKIVREIGGFSWTDSVAIRVIISKKWGEAALNVNRGNFIDGAARLHGIREETADRIWKRIVTAGTYALVYAHSVSYSKLALWCAWLKAHYPVEFYAASLAKADEAEQQFRLMKDAQGHGIDVHPPSLQHSRSTWSAAGNSVVAGWQQIPGVAEKTAQHIEAHRGDGYDNWSDLMRIPGIGPKKTENMQAFCTARDPFGLKRTDETLARVRRWLKRQASIPHPTHNGSQVAAIHMERRVGGKLVLGPQVTYCGIVKIRNYQDAVENRRSRSGEEVEDILKTLKRPDLLEYCYLACYDDTDEEVYLRVNRFLFPTLRSSIRDINVGHDVVVAVANRIDGFGTPVMVKRLWVVDPD